MLINTSTTTSTVTNNTTTEDEEETNSKFQIADFNNNNFANKNPNKFVTHLLFIRINFNLVKFFYFILKSVFQANESI